MSATSTAVPSHTETDTALLTGNYVIDSSHSRIGFVARHAMVTKVRGSFNQFDGRARLDAADPSRSSVQVTVKAASIDTRNADRDNHLRSNDFFDMERYPEITFVSTAVDPVDADHYRVTGDLAIKGVTRPVTIELEYTGRAVDPFGNSRVGLEGSVTVNRKDWGISWNAPLEAGGLLVSEKVTLELELSVVKSA